MTVTLTAVADQAQGATAKKEKTAAKNMVEAKKRSDDKTEFMTIDEFVEKTC